MGLVVEEKQQNECHNDHTYQGHASDGFQLSLSSTMFGVGIICNDSDYTGIFNLIVYKYYKAMRYALRWSHVSMHVVCFNYMDMVW